MTPASTFVSLGGDSLSYVECSVRLERRLGRLPAGLAPAHRRRARRRRAPAGTAAARHDGAAAGGRHPARRLDAHVPVVLPRRRPPAAGRRRVQHEPLPPVDRRHPRPRRRDGPLGRPVWRCRSSSFVAVCMVAGRRVRAGDVGAREQLPRARDAPGGALALLVRRGDRADPRAARAPSSPWGRCGASSGGSRTCSRSPCSPAPSCCASSGWRSAATTTCASSPRRRVVLRARLARAALDDAGSASVVTTALCVLTLPGFFLSPERGWFIAGGLVLLVWWREIPVPAGADPARRRRSPRRAW